MPRNYTTGALGLREFRQHFSDVISDRSLRNARPPENIPHENVEVKPAGNAQATPTLEERVKKRFVIQNQIAGLLVRKKFDQALGGANLTAEDTQDEFHVLGGELHATVRLNHFHRHLRRRIH